jgi:hypothetical protein
MHRFTILFDTDYRASVLEKDAVQAAANKLGLDSTPYGIRRKEDIAPVFEVLKGASDASISSKTPSLTPTASNLRNLH